MSLTVLLERAIEEWLLSHSTVDLNEFSLAFRLWVSCTFW